MSQARSDHLYLEEIVEATTRIGDYIKPSGPGPDNSLSDLQRSAIRAKLLDINLSMSRLSHASHLSAGRIAMPYTLQIAATPYYEFANVPDQALREMARDEMPILQAWARKQLVEIGPIPTAIPALPAKELPLPLPLIIEYCRNHPIESLCVFGSAARGEMSDQSDVDFLITFTSSFSPTLLTIIDIQEGLAQIVDRSVDLVMIDSLKPSIRQSVLDSSVQVFP